VIRGGAILEFVVWEWFFPFSTHVDKPVRKDTLPEQDFALIDKGLA
jgi:hypothetical protein